MAGTLACRWRSSRLIVQLAVLGLSRLAMAGELGDLLDSVLQHPQIKAASRQTEAAQAVQDAAFGRYFGTGTLLTGWHRYEDKRVVGVFTPGQTAPALTADRIAQAGVVYTLPVDVFGVIAANRERAQHDLRAAELLGRQQTLLKLHQAASAYLTLQSLLKQQEALQQSRRRVDATYQRVQKEFELGKVAGVDAKYAESEVARLKADQAVLNGALAQAQADLAEATGRSKFLPSPSSPIRVPPWAMGTEDALPLQIAEAKQASAQAQAAESRRALLPAFTLDASYFRNSVPGGDNRDTWVVGGVISLPLGVSLYRTAGAQRLSAAAATEQSEATRRDVERQLASLQAAYESSLADASSIEAEVAYREEVVQVEQKMQRLGNQTLENLFQHERDLLDARYRAAQAKARAAVAWSAAQIVIGLSADQYIARMERK